MSEKFNWAGTIVNIAASPGNTKSLFPWPGLKVWPSARLTWSNWELDAYKMQPPLDHKFCNSHASFTCSKEKQTLFPQSTARESTWSQQPHKHYRRRAMNVMLKVHAWDWYFIVGTNFVPKCVFIAKILKLHVRTKGFMRTRDNLFNKIVVLFVLQPSLAQIQIGFSWCQYLIFPTECPSSPILILL